MLRFVLVLVAAVLWTAATPAPAFAHIGPLTLVVDGDGADGVMITAVHQDGHPVEDRVPVELTATGPNGLTVGPLTLLPTGEGVGFYSTGSLLQPGRWQVRVTAPEPTPGQAEATINARAPTPGATPAAPPLAAPPADSTITTPIAITTAAALTLVTALIAYLALRRRPR